MSFLDNNLRLRGTSWYLCSEKVSGTHAEWEFALNGSVQDILKSTTDLVQAESRIRDVRLIARRLAIAAETGPGYIDENGILIAQRVLVEPEYWWPRMILDALQTLAHEGLINAGQIRSKLRSYYASKVLDPSRVVKSFKLRHLLGNLDDARGRLVLDAEEFAGVPPRLADPVDWTDGFRDDADSETSAVELIDNIEQEQAVEDADIANHHDDALQFIDPPRFEELESLDGRTDSDILERGGSASDAIDELRGTAAPHDEEAQQDDLPQPPRSPNPAHSHEATDVLRPDNLPVDNPTAQGTVRRHGGRKRPADGAAAHVPRKRQRSSGIDRDPVTSAPGGGDNPPVASMLRRSTRASAPMPEVKNYEDWSRISHQHAYTDLTEEEGDNQDGGDDI